MMKISASASNLRQSNCQMYNTELEPSSKALPSSTQKTRLTDLKKRAIKKHATALREIKMEEYKKFEHSESNGAQEMQLHEIEVPATSQKDTKKQELIKLADASFESPDASYVIKNNEMMHLD